MKIEYFGDTDTVLIAFSDAAVAETREINENIVIDLDTEGNLVAITIEHAGESSRIIDIAGRGPVPERILRALATPS